MKPVLRLPWINAGINSHRHLLNRRVPLHTCPPSSSREHVHVAVVVHKHTMNASLTIPANARYSNWYSYLFLIVRRDARVCRAGDFFFSIADNNRRASFLFNFEQSWNWIPEEEISDVARIRKTFARDWIRSSGNYSILDGIVSPLKENYKRNIREKNNEIAALTRNTFRSRRSTT